MNKLIVNFSNRIVTGSLYSQTAKTYENNGTKLLDIFSKTNSDTLGVEVVMVNEGREIVFIFNQKNVKKDSFMNVLAKPDGSGLEAEISGACEVTLRKGVAPILQEYGDNLDLRIRAITSSDGEWSGFIPYISGISSPTSPLKSYLNLMPKVKGFVK